MLRPEPVRVNGRGHLGNAPRRTPSLRYEIGESWRVRPTDSTGLMAGAGGIESTEPPAEVGARNSFLEICDLRVVGCRFWCRLVLQFDASWCACVRTKGAYKPHRIRRLSLC